MCCRNVKVKLDVLNPPSESLLSLFSENLVDSKLFLKNTRKYNSAFQMTSFGADKVIHYQYIPIFKIQGQIYHEVWLFLLVPDAESKVLQIYFIGDENAQVNLR